MMIIVPNVLHMALLDIRMTKNLINGINQPICEKWIYSVSTVIICVNTPSL